MDENEENPDDYVEVVEQRLTQLENRVEKLESYVMMNGKGIAQLLQMTAGIFRKLGAVGAQMQASAGIGGVSEGLGVTKVKLGHISDLFCNQKVTLSCAVAHATYNTCF